MEGKGRERRGVEFEGRLSHASTTRVQDRGSWAESSSFIDAENRREREESAFVGKRKLKVREE